MSAHDPALTLRPLVEWCDKAIALRSSMTWEEFRADWRKQMLGERLAEVTGQAVKRLPEDLRARQPQPPWRKIAGTRDYIAHGYDSVDYDVIWGVLDVEAGRLKDAVSAILVAEFPAGARATARTLTTVAQMPRGLESGGK
jgi:uncharacterized protein with HEPN domain